MSATTPGRGPAVSARTGLNEPVRRARATAAKANARAEPAKANAMATPARKPPSGGPTNWFIVSSTAYRRPFAFDRSSRRTIDGITDWAAVSNSVSPTPSTNAVTYSSHRLSVLVTIVSAMTSATTRAQDRDADHRPAAVEAVGERARDEHEDQPRQPADDGDARDEDGGVGQADREQREGDPEHAVGEVRGRGRGPELPVVGAEAGAGGGCRGGGGGRLRGHRLRLVNRLTNVNHLPRIRDMERRAATHDEARALSNPLRLRILRLCLDRAMTNEELAARLGLNAGTMLHHVRLLVATGFLAAEDERRGARGAVERPVPGDGQVVDARRGRGGGERQDERRDARADRRVPRGGGRGAAGVPADRGRGSACGSPRTSSRRSRARIDALAHELKDADDPAGEPYGFFVGLHRRAE